MTSGDGDMNFSFPTLLVFLFYEFESQTWPPEGNVAAYTWMLRIGIRFPLPLAITKYLQY